jgi:hypothetical protein
MIRRLAFLAVLLAAFLPAVAADHDQNFYHRTGTKPPVSGDFLLGPTVNYTDKLGVGGTFGYQWHRIGVTLLGSVSAVQLKGENGTTEFRRYCQTFKVPYSVGDRTQAEFAVTALFTLRKAK